MRPILHFSRLVLILATVTGSFLLGPHIKALAEDTSPSKTNETASITRVPKDKADALIQSRVSKIFAATRWFPEVQVEVKEGIVFLKGKVAQAEYRNWAITLLHNTEGVVDVIDELEVTEPDHSVLKPAQEEAQLLIEKITRILPYLLSSILILTLFIGIAALTRRLVVRLLSRKKISALINEAVANLALLSMLLLGLYFALRTSGLSGLAFTVLGGTGIIGIGIGFALKGSFENYVAGLLISFRELFRRGELVQINGIEGVVQAVTTRGTTIMDYEGNNVTIPNAQVYQSIIKNLTRNPNMRAEFLVGIGYDDSIDEARAVIQKTLESLSDKILKDPESIVSVDTLGAATVNLKVYFWFNAIQYSKIKIRSLVIQKVKEALIDANISLPDDAREVVFKSPLEIVQQHTAITADQTSPAATPSTPSRSSAAGVDPTPDLNNELQQIRKQAELSPNPEGGKDLLTQ